MNKKIYFFIIINICILALFILINESLAVSNNLNPTACINVNRGLIRNSSLTPLEDGYMRVYYDSNNNYIGVEYYDKAFKILKKNKLDLELEIYGGFYAGNDAYYLVEGQNNPNENDSLEVIRIIKYDTNWNRLGTAKITSNPSMFGGEVRYPFDVGNVEMLEVDNKLYLVTGHEGYVDSSVGQGHQGFLMIEIDKNTLTGKIIKSDLSHSFSQYIDQKDSNIYVLELSEGGRCTKLSKYNKSNLSKTSIPIFNYGGTRTSAWAIPCYASVNGMSISQSNVLSIGTSIDQSQYDNVSSSLSHNIYLTVTPINDFTQSATQTKWITNYANDGKCFTGLEITKINDNRFMISWEEASAEYGELDMIDNDTLSICKLHYIFVDGSGEKISEEYIANASMSDCKPFVDNGKVIYYASNGNMVDFYAINCTNGNFEKTMHRVAGENIIWDLDENGVLSIKGEGEMYVDTEIMLKDEISKVRSPVTHYYDSDNSWSAIRNNVKKIIISEGITSIDNEEFIGFSNLSEIIIPDSVEKIGEKSFKGSRMFRTLYLSKNIKEIGDKAFFSGYYTSKGDLYYLNVYTQKGSYVDSWASELNGTNVYYVDDLDLTDSNTKTNLRVVGESTVKLTVESIETDNNDYKDMKNKVSDKIVLGSYNISTNSGKCFGNNTVTFNVGKNFSEKNVLLLQKKQNGTINIEEKKVDSDGNITVITDELSSFMIAVNPKDISFILGDINGDGKVNGKDWIRLYEHISETNELNDYQLLCADVNKDGKVNGKDWIRLYEHINETNPLF